MPQQTTCDIIWSFIRYTIYFKYQFKMNNATIENIIIQCTVFMINHGICFRTFPESADLLSTSGAGCSLL